MKKRKKKRKTEKRRKSERKKKKKNEMKEKGGNDICVVWVGCQLAFSFGVSFISFYPFLLQPLFALD